MIYYAFLELSGKLSGLDSAEITATFNGLLSQPGIMFIFSFIAIIYHLAYVHLDLKMVLNELQRL